MTDIALPTQEQARTLTDRIKKGFAEANRLRALKAQLPPEVKPKPVDERSVYFIQADNGLIKIGVATSPKERLRTLRTMSPAALRLVLVLPGRGAPGESELHTRFAEHRSHGEWFHPAPELLNYIREQS